MGIHRYSWVYMGVIGFFSYLIRVLHVLIAKTYCSKVVLILAIEAS